MAKRAAIHSATSGVPSSRTVVCACETSGQSRRASASIRIGNGIVALCVDNSVRQGRIPEQVRSGKTGHCRSNDSVRESCMERFGLGS